MNDIELKNYLNGFSKEEIIKKYIKLNSDYEQKNDDWYESVITTKKLSKIAVSLKKETINLESKIRKLEKELVESKLENKKNINFAKLYEKKEYKLNMQVLNLKDTLSSLQYSISQKSDTISSLKDKLRDLNNGSVVALQEQSIKNLRKNLINLKFKYSKNINNLKKNIEKKDVFIKELKETIEQLHIEVQDLIKVIKLLREVAGKKTFSSNTLNLFKLKSRLKKIKEEIDGYFNDEYLFIIENKAKKIANKYKNSAKLRN